jgi:hypothetical protein
METEPQPVPAPELSDPVCLAWPADPEAAVSLMLSEAELLRVAAVTASATLPPLASESVLRDLSPLGKRRL